MRAHKSSRGFSLIELLVVIAIISIIAAMYMSTLSKVLGKVKTMAVAEGMRQEHIGQLADTANMVAPSRPDRPGRNEARTLYRKTVQTSEGESFVTEMCYMVRNEAEFRAYWHTLINPNNTQPLEYSPHGLLRARDESGQEFQLAALRGPWERLNDLGGSFPIMWEFLSTKMDETTLNGIGVNVVYSDGHVQYLSYPREYPSCATVAELSHRYMKGK